MATLGASMVALLTANWAGAGATPTFGFLIDFQMDLAPTTEQVLVRLPIHEDVDPVNDLYSNFKFTMQLRVKSTVSEDRLKVLTDETIRIINTYAITGITRQFAKRGENTSDRKKQVFSYDVWATLEEHMSTAGTSYSSPGAGDVVFPAEVTINAVHVLSEALILGSANAAWHTLSYLSEGAAGPEAFVNWNYENEGVNNQTIWYMCHLPTNKGSLKLYVAEMALYVNDADANNYIDTLRVYGVKHSDGSISSRGEDPTNHNSVTAVSWDMTDINMSAYSQCLVRVTIVVDTDAALNFTHPELKCYYAA